MFKAVTSIWCVKDRLDHVVYYVEDEEKTVDAVIDYVNNDNKTNEKKYVTCVNCDSFDPCKSMMNTKKFFNDHKQIMAFHGYQSFEPGEVSGEVAHEIGVKLVEELYGNRFEVVIATHVDKNHIHNHFLLNSTSFVDGKRFCNTKKDYQMLRETSDKLCLEYGLSIIKNPKKYTKKVNQYILKSFMNEIKRDIDATVLECASYMEFSAVMHNKGYSFGEINDEPVIYHPYCEEPIYIKSLGNQYLKVEEMHLNRFGRAKLDYLKKHDYLLYFKLLSKNELNDYLLKVQKEADDLYDRLVEEYKIKWNVTEELKQKNQIKWVLMMNNINNCVYEIINKEIIII